MTPWLPVIPPVLEYLRHPVSRHDNDASAVNELNWRHAPIELPAGLELQWLGTAGFRLGYEGTQVLIDPYLTRPRLSTVLRRRSPLAASAERVRRHVQAADAVLVGHTHFDHALDVPLIAREHGATVYGSASLQRLMALHGQPERAVVAEPYRVYEVGPFAVTFVPSRHSKLVLGLRVPSEGELTCDALDELHAGAYRCGQVWGIHIAVAGVTLYHQGSADLIDDAIVHRDVDLFLCGIAGRGFTPGYTRRILRRLSPRVVVPSHHDNFFRPLDQPMGFSLNVNVGGFVDEVRAVSGDFALRSLDLLQTVRG